MDRQALYTFTFPGAGKPAGLAVDLHEENGALCFHDPDYSINHILCLFIKAWIFLDALAHALFRFLDIRKHEVADLPNTNGQSLK